MLENAKEKDDNCEKTSLEIKEINSMKNRGVTNIDPVEFKEKIELKLKNKKLQMLKKRITNIGYNHNTRTNNKKLTLADVYEKLENALVYIGTLETKLSALQRSAYVRTRNSPTESRKVLRQDSNAVSEADYSYFESDEETMNEEFNSSML